MLISSVPHAQNKMLLLQLIICKIENIDTSNDWKQSFKYLIFELWKLETQKTND